MATQQPVTGRRPIVLYVGLLIGFVILALLVALFFSRSEQSRRTDAETQLTQVQETVEAQETALVEARGTVTVTSITVTDTRATADAEATVPLGTPPLTTTVPVEGTPEADGETLLVSFLRGTDGITTTRSYTGRTTITVEGAGQAGAGAWSDAFYIFSDSSEQPITPLVIREAENLALWINGQPASSWVDPLPPYAEDHTYTFTIEAPGGPLAFAVGDRTPEDNLGNFTVTVAPAP